MVALLMVGGFMASGISNGPGSQMSSRILAIFSRGMRRALLALLVVTALPVQAAEPIPLQVIPYQVGDQAIPVLPFLLPPPPLLLEPAKPKKRRPSSGRDKSWDDDFDWLMD